MAKTMAPQKATGPALDPGLVRKLLTDMLLIRRFEEKAAEAYALGKIGGFLHLYIGQEAVAVGATSVLRGDDYAISAYREHGHCLAKGSDPKRMMAELFGRRDGLSKGKGGSMHLFDRSVGFLGGHAIVGAHLPLAAGAAFAIKYEARDAVVVCYFGDGAVAQGEFHESLNLAALWKLPVIYICENNRYAMGTSTERALAQTQIWKFGQTYGIRSEKVDGMDVLAVRRITDQLVAQARERHEPSIGKTHHAVWLEHGERNPGQPHLADPWRQQPGHCAQQGRLPCPVRPHERQPLARAHDEVRVGQDVARAVGERRAADVEGGWHRGHSS